MSQLRNRWLALAFSLGATLSGWADSGPPSPPTPSVPDRPQTSPGFSAAGNPSNSSNDYYNVNGSSNYSRDYSSGGGANGFSSTGYEAPLPPRRMPIYFPPVPPRLNAHVDLPSPAQAQQPAPAELALYVNEPFYAPLSTRLVEKTLRDDQRKRLDAYLAEKLRLQNELHAALVASKDAEPAVRERALATLAQQQAPRLAALEQEAENFRAIIVSGKLFQPDVSWDSTRDWRLGNRFATAPEAIRAQFQVMRAAAFYQKGLSPAQRRLLREVAMELGDIPMATIKETEEQPDEPHAPSDQNPLLYFSPETARVRLPADLPPELADKVAAYEREKSLLKKELRDTVYRLDASTFSMFRQREYESLAKSEEARLTELENLAEEIRRDLARLPNRPQPPEPPAIPPAMYERLVDFIEARRALQKNLLRMITEAGRLVKINQVSYIKDKQGHYRLNIVVDPRDQTPEKLKKLNEEFAAYSQENGPKSQVLVGEQTRLRNDAADFLGLKKGAPDTEKEVDRFLGEMVDVIESRQDWQLYSDYRTAVLEPGLSPAQRRLLFDAALVELELPLPGVEFTSLGGEYAQSRPRPRRSPMELMRSSDLRANLPPGGP